MAQAGGVAVVHDRFSDFATNLITQNEENAMVTGEQVRAAVIAAGITYIPHHDCGCCGCLVAFTVQDGDLYFNPACGCSYSESPAELRSWDSAANWINMQSTEDARARLMTKFGLG